MRPLKFRAWHKEKRIMVIPHRIEFPIADDSRIFWQNDATWGYPFTMELMQYTGLKDKNGKEIYEGDIVKTINEQQEEYPVEDEFAGEVIYHKCSFAIKQPHDTYTPHLCNYTITSIEIIGNICEHPELLEEVSR